VVPVPEPELFQPLEEAAVNEEPPTPNLHEELGSGDGAHTPEAVDWLLARLPARDHVLCVSILGDKRVDEMLQRLGRAGSSLVATKSSNPRSLPANELAARAEAHFQEVQTVPSPRKALARARAAGRPVIVTGSLYLLADLYP